MDISVENRNELLKILGDPAEVSAFELWLAGPPRREFELYSVNEKEELLEKYLRQSRAAAKDQSRWRIGKF